MIVGVIGSGSIGPDLAYGFLTAVAQTPGASAEGIDAPLTGLCRREAGQFQRAAVATAAAW